MASNDVPGHLIHHRRGLPGLLSIAAPAAVLANVLNNPAVPVLLLLTARPGRISLSPE